MPQTQPERATAPVVDPPDASPPGPAETGPSAEAPEAASEPEPAPPPPTTATQPAGTVTIEHEGKHYMPTSLEALRQGSEPPGRVTLDARFVRELPCAPCPPHAKCDPCAPRLLFEETGGNRESQFGLFGSGLKNDTVYRLFLRIEAGYAESLGTTPPSDPRVQLIRLEGAALLDP